MAPLTTTPVATAVGRSPAPATGRRPARRRLTRRTLTPYLMLLPALLLELLIHLIPMLGGIWMSLLRLTQFFIRNWSAAPFAGLANYRVAVDVNSAAGADLLHSFGVTLAFTVASVGLAWLLGTTGAVLTQRAFRGRGLLRTLFLTPYALPTYAAVITWSFLLQRDTGMVNHVLVDQLGLASDRPFWLIGNNSFVALLVVSVWRTWPFAFLCLTAGLQNIPQELYEAAAMDGAGFGRQLRSITLPMLRPVNQVLVLVLFLWTFNDFNTPFVLFGRSAPHAADLIAIHIYQSSFLTWNFGLGSAMSVLLLLFLLVATAVYLTVTSRRRSDA
ncbi:carbohydrate ABC transporter permease [Planosporangium sp. 12N6]|uniref:carbohydrate ABC transporter permease n=1 Tax=Planosporangium spinosum TaxID=3402278 RepID=UPI003CF8C549